MIDDQIVILALETYFGFKLDWWPEHNREKMRAAIEAAIEASDSRIAELEAENKTLREAMRPISQWSFEAQDGSPAIKELHDDILRVRAALNGEKK